MQITELFFAGVRVLIAAATLTSHPPQPAIRAGASAFPGSYRHQEVIPGPAGTVGEITYTVDIRRSGKTLAGWIRAEGYQTPATVLKCRVRARPRSLALYFAGYGNGALTNGFGVRQYAPGALLATLRPLPRGGKPGAVLFWHALMPPDGRKRAQGTFFERVR